MFKTFAKPVTPGLTKHTFITALDSWAILSSVSSETMASSLHYFLLWVSYFRSCARGTEGCLAKNYSHSAMIISKPSVSFHSSSSDRYSFLTREERKIKRSNRRTHCLYREILPYFYHKSNIASSTDRRQGGNDVKLGFCPPAKIFH